MDRATIVRLLAEHDAEIRAFGVREMYLFGSHSRGEGTASSDVDILVDFDQVPPTFRQHMGLVLFLEELLGTTVDVATRRTITPEFALGIERDLLRVA